LLISTTMTEVSEILNVVAMDETWGISSRRLRETFIGGAWHPSSGRQVMQLIDPSYDQPMAVVRESSASDVELAVSAACSAAPALRAMSIDARIEHLSGLAHQLEVRSTALAAVISAQMGMPVKYAENYQVAGAISIIPETIAALRTFEFTEQVGWSRVSHHPIGVVAAITPWNYPLPQTLSKLAPAFAAGCPIVLKPSEVTPLDALILAEAAEAAGFPPGAFNLVLGTGPHVGEQLVRDPRVTMVSVTGSTRTGRRVAEIGAPRLKRLALELGGKSPSVVLPDADLQAAVTDAVDSVMINSGQTCTALTRLLVPLEVLAQAEEIAASAARRYTVGPADDPTADVGPLANATQRQSVGDHLDRALIDGARIVWSHPTDQLPERGCFVAPHVFVAPDPSIVVAQQEIFGPVLTIIPYVNESDAVQIANGTNYGLAAAVWSADEQRALAVADRIEAGYIAINGAPFNGLAPFGGHKQSGIGRELAARGIREFTELKSVQTTIKKSR
jgi:aldehyde dehydrogenase (NAD+)